MFHIKVLMQVIIFSAVANIHVQQWLIDSTQPQWNFEGAFCQIKIRTSLDYTYQSI